MRRIFSGYKPKISMWETDKRPSPGRSGEEGPWDSKLSISRKPFFFFLRQSVCLIIQQCLHEEDAEKCMTCKQLGSQV